MPEQKSGAHNSLHAKGGAEGGDVIHDGCDIIKQGEKAGSHGRVPGLHDQILQAAQRKAPAPHNGEQAL